MTEEEAKAWLDERFDDAAVQRLTALVDLVTTEATRQSLIAASTVPDIWVRHIVDSAQLVPLVPSDGRWLDIGSGAGFPGLVVAILRRQETLLVEPRGLRAAFLVKAAAALQLDHVEVITAKVEAVRIEAAVISARAVAPAEKLLLAASACATRATRWLLPRGRTGAAELAGLSSCWRGQFHVEQSLTDRQSSILVLSGMVRKVGQR